MSWSSSGADAKSGDDVNAAGQAPGMDVSAGPGDSGVDGSASSGAGAEIGINPVQQMSLWNSWATSDPSQCDAEVRVGWYGA